jgi:hypothetical protein
MAKFNVVLSTNQRGDEQCGSAPTRAEAFKVAHEVLREAARREQAHHWFRGETVAVRIEEDAGG